MYGTLISVEALAALMRESRADIVIVDCRFSLADVEWGRGEYTLGHIPGAVYAHLNEDLSGTIQSGVTGRHPLPAPEKFRLWAESVGISNSAQIVAYDQGGGGVASRLWWLMRWIGHDAVAVLDGGWAAWQKAGLPSDNEVPELKRANYISSLRHDLSISVETVERWASDGMHTVVDAREAKRYAGIEEPIDPIAGHIPGAVNLPFAENLGTDGTWKSAEALRTRFASLLEHRKSEEVVFYCGSGVTACHNILALKHAGLGDAKLYPGSWSEWITNDKRGVEVSE